MIIQNHEINMQSHRSEIHKFERSQQLEVQGGFGNIDMPVGEADSGRAFQMSLSAEAMSRFNESMSFTRNGSVTHSSGSGAVDDEEMNLPSKLQVAKTLLEKFFGIKVKIYKPGEHGDGAQASGAGAPSPEAPQNQAPGFGMRLTFHERRYDKESVSFAANGNVTTEDGREINFDVKLEMSRETLEEITVRIEAGEQMTDPLALNFDGKGVRLTEEKMDFDLDMDGTADRISFLEEGSGFLVLDKNQNGEVDDGSELFGPQTNNGFLELRAYDTDSNDWIDENDSIFYQLNLWTRDQEGSDQLSTLKENDIGAIYLNTMQTRFDLQEGQLKESGIYLSESGTANLIQEIDLVT